MAVVATVIALFGPPARAAADGKPCRTPCLSVNVPRDAPEKPEKPAEAEPKPAPAARPVAKPRPQATASAAPASPYEAQKEPVAKKPAPSKRCTDINMRAAVGEPLSDEDMKTLRSQC